VSDRVRHADGEACDGRFGHRYRRKSQPHTVVEHSHGPARARAQLRRNGERADLHIAHSLRFKACTDGFQGTHSLRLGRGGLSVPKGLMTWDAPSHHSLRRQEMRGTATSDAGLCRLPPVVRRTPRFRLYPAGRFPLTSARGEYFFLIFDENDGLRPPPRARRTHLRREPIVRSLPLTSARGEHSQRICSYVRFSRSPPCARRTPLRLRLSFDSKFVAT
jgi:hypothetical protein